jgi:hypothetical protein
MRFRWKQTGSPCKEFNIIGGTALRNLMRQPGKKDWIKYGISYPKFTIFYCSCPGEEKDVQQKKVNHIPGQIKKNSAQCGHCPSPEVTFLLKGWPQNGNLNKPH